MGKSNIARSPKVVKKSSPAKLTNQKKSSAGSTGGKNGKFEAVKDAVFRSICERFSMGVKEASKAEVGLENGYTNPRSDTLLKVIKALLDEDLIQNCGKKKDHYTLTTKGEKNIPSELAFQPKSLADLHEKYVTLLMKKVKGGQNKIRSLWEILLDRKEHSIAEVAERLGYRNPRSFQNTKIIQTMKEAGIAEGGAGKVQLAPKCFPAGFVEWSGKCSCAKVNPK